MIVWIILIILLIVVVLYFVGKSNDSSRNNKSNYNSNASLSSRCPQSNNNVQHRQRPSMSSQIKTLYDSEDASITYSQQQKTMVSDVRKYQREKRRTVNTSGTREQISIDLSWSDDLSELLEATEVVYTNAQMNCNRRLESARFQYYVNLHYRSFTAADLCHDKMEEIYPYYNQINATIKRLNDRNDLLRVGKTDYEQIIKIKDTMKSILAVLKLRVEELNKQTAILRDKIRDECGTGGKKWYDNLMQRRLR